MKGRASHELKNGIEYTVACSFASRESPKAKLPIMHKGIKKKEENGKPITIIV